MQMNQVVICVQWVWKQVPPGCKKLMQSLMGLHYTYDGRCGNNSKHTLYPILHTFTLAVKSILHILKMCSQKGTPGILYKG